MLVCTRYAMLRVRGTRAHAGKPRRAIACKAIETIQRVYRGYQGRLLTEFVRQLVRRVIKAQVGAVLGPSSVVPALSRYCPGIVPLLSRYCPAIVQHVPL